MFSRTHLAPALLVLAFLTACAPKLGEDAPPPTEYKIEGLSCLTGASAVIGDFAGGTAQTRDLPGAWNCFGSAFRSFERYIQGNSADSYTPQELATFIERTFAQDSARGTPRLVIGPGLQREFMKIKQIFLGGRRDVVTRAEVKALADLTRTFSDLTVRINPYMKILVMKWERGTAVKSDIEFFRQGNQTLQEVAADLAGMVNTRHEMYRLDDFQQFVIELGKLIGGGDGANNAIARFIPVAKKVKKALTGTDENLILPTEWRRILVLGGRSYIQYLRYHYFIKTTVEAGEDMPIDHVAETVEDTVSILEDLVGQKPQPMITKAELTEICASLSQAWDAFKYSDKLIEEILRLKVSLFGGNMDGLSVADFQNIRGKVFKVRDVFVTLKPFMDVYTGKWDSTDRPYADGLAYFTQASKLLEDQASVIAGLLESSYNLNSARTLLAEIERLYPSEEKAKAKAAGDDEEPGLIDYIPLLVEGKNVYFADRDPVLTKEQAATFLAYATRLYSSMSFYSAFVKNRSDRELDTYDAMGRLSERVVAHVNELLKNRVKAKVPANITREEVARLAIQLKKLGWLPKDFTEGTIEDLVKTLVNRILNPPERRFNTKVKPPNGIDAVTVNYVRQEFQVYLQTRVFLLKTFGASDETQIKPTDLRKQIADAAKAPGISPELKLGLRNLTNAITSSLPFIIDPDGRLKIGRRFAGASFDLLSMERHNTIGELARLLISSYASSKAQADKGETLSAKEADTAFAELRKAAVEWGLIEKDNTQFMKSRFREANLFMPRSNGDTTASVGEIHELVYAIFSGVTINALMRPSLEKDCRLTKTDKEVFYPCLYRSYQKSFRSYAVSMPDFLIFQRDQSDEGFNHFVTNALKGVGYIPDNGQMAKLGDVSLMPPLLQYIELIYARFDLDANGIIDVTEAKRAFPSFKALFKILAKKQLDDGTLKEENLIAVFTWVLKYGKPPSGFGEMLRFAVWMQNEASWDVAADRTRLAEILGYVADQLRAAGQSGAAN